MKLLKFVPVLLLALVFVFAGCSANNHTTGTGMAASHKSTAQSSSSQQNVAVNDNARTAEGTTTSQTASEVSYITAAEAEATALKHAGITADDVKGLRSEFDYDNGVAEYDVDFYYNGYEYDYDINAVTGKVTWHEKELEKTTDNKNDSTGDNTSTTATAANSSKLTAAEAEAIALKHAGYTADNVKGLRSEYDRDNGVYEYDIEFRADGYEFDYEINAETGAIISFDKDWDD